MNFLLIFSFSNESVPSFFCGKLICGRVGYFYFIILRDPDGAVPRFALSFSQSNSVYKIYEGLNADTAQSKIENQIWIASWQH